MCKPNLYVNCSQLHKARLKSQAHITIKKNILQKSITWAHLQKQSTELQLLSTFVS